MPAGEEGPGEEAPPPGSPRPLGQAPGEAQRPPSPGSGGDASAAAPPAALPTSPFASASLRPLSSTSEEAAPCAQPAPLAQSPSLLGGGGPCGPARAHSPTGSDRSSRAARDDERLGSAGGRSSRASLERMLSTRVQSCLTPAELASPAEVRMLLPGVDLREHGVEEVLPGSELPMVVAPRGLSLRDALDRLGSSDLSREPSLGLGARPGSGRSQRRAGTPTPSGTPGSPRFSLRPSLSGSRPPTPGAAGLPPRSPALGGGSVPQLPRPASPPPGTSRLQEASKAAAIASPIAAQRGSSSKENHVAEEQQRRLSSAGTPPAEAAAELVAGAVPPSPPGPELQLAAREQRPWTVDGVPGSLLSADMRAASLDAKWRARSAMRMWPMLAPFVPRLLREDILSAQPRCRSISDMMAADEYAASTESRAPSMNPCVELLPAAVMIADITGFTALTEALSTKGSAGVELLTKCMNRYFSQVIELLLQFRGDIMKFAGDSMIVAFWPTAEEAVGSEDGGLHAATLRAATSASELSEAFGAMRMLPTGEAIPVPRNERTQGAQAEAAEVEWYEDFVHRAEGFFLTASTTLLQGAAKPVGVVLSGAARPAGTVLHGTAVGVTTAVSKGSSAALYIPRAASRFRARRGLRSMSLASSQRMHLPAEERDGGDEEGGAEASVNGPPPPQQQQQEEEEQEKDDVGGEEEQQAGQSATGTSAPSTSKWRSLHRHMHSAIIHRSSQLVLSPSLGFRRSVRRTQSDATTLQHAAEETLAGRDESVAEPSRAASSKVFRQQRSLSLGPRRYVSVRPPELPHRRSSDRHRPGLAADSAAAGGTSIPSAVLRVSTAPADVLDALADVEPSSPLAQDAESCRQDSTGGPRVDSTAASDRHFGSEGLPSPSGTSFTSTYSCFQRQDQAASGAGGQAPFKTRITEEDLDADGYDVVTVTAGSSTHPAAPLHSQPPLPPSASSAAQQQHPGPAKSDSFPWSLRFGKLLKRAKKAPKKLWRMSTANFVGPAAAAGGRGAQPADRTASVLSSASAISELDALAAFSQRVWSSVGQDPSSPRGSSPPTSPSPGRRFVPRRHSHLSRSLHAAPSSQPREEERLMLSLKVLVGAGTVCAFHVGGGQQSSVADAHGTPRWEFFIGDPPSMPSADGPAARHPIAQLAAIEPEARAGEVVLSHEVGELLAGDLEVVQLPGGALHLHKVLTPCELPLEAVNAQDSSVNADRASQEAARELAALGALPDVLQGRALQVLRMHVLENVRLRIEAGHIDYVNEIRNCTTLFLGFPSLNSLLGQPSESALAAAEAELSKVQQAVEVVQKKMRAYDGSFVQFRADEKGFLAICAFGLPGRSHEDGAARGIQAALSIVAAMQKRGGQAVVGVTTGQLFCAMVGSRRRSEYTAFGDAINLAARLMVKAKEGQLGPVLCDSNTQHRAQGKALYAPLEPIRVKGKRMPVEIYAVSSLRSADSLALPLPLPLVQQLQPDSLSSSPEKRPLPDPAQPGSTALAGSPSLPASQLPHRVLSSHFSGSDAGAAKPWIGREEVVDTIVARVRQLVEEQAGGVILIEGEPGMGKSRLVEELQQSELGGLYECCNMFLGLGRADRKSQSFYPWRRIFRELFVHDRTFGQLYCRRDANPQEQHMVVTELGRRMAEAHPDYGTYLGLLADALDLPLADFPAPPPPAPPAATPLDLHSLAAVAEGRPSATPSPLQPAPSRALGENEREFIVHEERARSFAMRLRRSLSATQPQPQQAPRLVGSPHRSPNRLPATPNTPPSAAGASGGSSGSSLSRSSAGSSHSGEGRPVGPLARQGSMLARAITARGIPALLGHSNTRPKEISGNLKAKKVMELLVGLLHQFAEAYGPLVLILEDLHFFDSFSWKLLGNALGDLLSRVLFVCTFRPIFNDLPSLRLPLATKEMLYSKIDAAYRHVVQLPSTLQIALQPFTVEQTRQYISTAMGGVEVGSDIARLVWEKSNGLPAFIEQLVVYLQIQLAQHGDRGISLSAPDVLLHAMDVIRNTASIHSTVTDRVDRLRPDEQLTLKVASVGGLTIYLDLLQVAHPQHPTLQQVEAHLRGLEAASFVRQDPAEPNTWQFARALARDVVYDLIPVGQRREWHGRLAFAMEMCMRDHKDLPASTIAYHWSASCKEVEVTQWWLTMKAVEYWEKSAMEAIADGAYADGLPLLQKAQDLAALLADFFGTDEAAVARKLAEVTTRPEGGMETLPSGLVTLPSATPHSVTSTLGSKDLGSAVFADVTTMPLVALLRRIHWERCMAAMCVAAELSVESLNQAMLHCLRALLLLGVPMPWDAAYRRKRRWWHFTFDACFVAGMCCCSRGMQDIEVSPLGAEGAMSANRRVGEQEMADMAWLSRPGTLLGSIQVPPSLLIQQAQQAQRGAVGFRMPSALHPDLLGSSGSGLDASAEERPATPAATAASHLEWWQETQLEAAAASAPCLPPGAPLPPAPELELAAAVSRQQQRQQGPDGSALDGSFTLPLLSPFESTTRPFPAAQSQPGAGGEPAAAAGGSVAMAPLAETDGSAQVSTEPSLTPLVTSSQAASEARRTSASEPAAAALPQHEQQQEQPTGVAGPAEGSQAPDGAAAPPAGVGGMANMAGAAAADPSQQSPRGGLPSLRHMRAATSQLARRSAQQQQQQSEMAPIPSAGLAQAHSGASAAALAAGDSYGGRQPVSTGRLSGELALEAAVVLEILCTVLLMPEHLDPDALRYVMFACKWLQGRRVTEDSLYYYAWVECANALHHQRRQRQRAGIIALKQLTTMVGYVFVPGQRPEEPGAGDAAADLAP